MPGQNRVDSTVTNDKISILVRAPSPSPTEDANHGNSQPPGTSSSASTGPATSKKITRNSSEPVIQFNLIEKPKWRTKRVKRQRNDSTSSGTSTSAGLPFYDQNSVYRPTTVSGIDFDYVGNQSPEPDLPDNMANSMRFREEMSEYDPLRNADDWNGEQIRTNIWKRHKRTLAWAACLGVIAISLLVIAGGIAIYFEWANSEQDPVTNSTLNQSNLVNLQQPEPDHILKLAPKVSEDLNDHSSHKSQSARANRLHEDVDRLSKVKWPLEGPKRSKRSKPSQQSPRILLQSSKMNPKPFVPQPKFTSNVNVVNPIVVPILLEPNDPIPASIVQQGLEAGKLALAERENLERTLYNQDYSPKSGWAGSVYSVSTRWASPEYVNQSLAGFMMDMASQRIAALLNLSKSEAREGIQATIEEPVHQYCQKTEISSCDSSAVYRSYNGSCNNLQNTRWGSSFQPFRRILYPDYADGISKPRSGAQVTSGLPSARQVTTTMFKEDIVGTHNDPRASYMVAVWAQFVTHDIAFAPSSTGLNSSAIPCCVNGKLTSPQHPECYPIEIQGSDPFYSNVSVSCINMVRSAPYPSCTFGPREQVNQVTSYLDGSTLYGSTESEFNDVERGIIGFAEPQTVGRLPMSYLDDGRPLPTRSSDLTDGCNIAEAVEERQFCFKTGDKRINEDASLSALNSIWARQHNLVASDLSALNPHWNHRQVFEETRRIIIAQIQHITYNEFLPVLLGPSFWQVVGLNPSPYGYYNGYDPETDPGISNGFTAAAFRLGHSMLPGIIKMIGPHSKNMDFIQIHKLMYNPFRIYGLGRLESLIRGHAAQPSAKPDLYFSNQITQHVFQLRNNTYGLDLPAMDIQRGRDHGIPGYLEWRKICNLTEIMSFDDLNSIWDSDAVQQASGIYKSVEDIDLYVGGLAERAIPDGMVGPTFSCILADQFLRLRKGDRFWYESSVQPKPFSPAQLRVIRETNLAQILCTNTDGLIELQPEVMRLPGSNFNNNVQPCGAKPLGKLDFSAWKEDPTLVQFTLKATPADESWEDYTDENDRIDAREESVKHAEGRNVTKDEQANDGSIIIDFKSG